MGPLDNRSFYTRGDSFSIGDSKEHAERALVTFGATDVRSSQRGDFTAIAFRAGGRQFRIVICLPDPHVVAGVGGGSGKVHGPEVTVRVSELSARRFWHSFALSIDAKLAAVAAGVATLESEFLAHVVLPGNRTVIDELEPVIASAYQSGQRPSIKIAAAP